VETHCQWSATRDCPFAKYNAELTEFAGENYCPFHLPLHSDQKLGHAAFANALAEVTKAGARDFRGTVFPGRSLFVPSPQYRIADDLNLQEIYVGSGVTLVFENVDGNISKSTFVADGVLQGGGNGRSILCENATIIGNFTFEGVEASTTVSFRKSEFKAAGRFNAVGKLSGLGFANCKFATAPIFGLTQELPQNTEFDGATFVPHVEDEHIYRNIRVHFSKNQDRDAEGQFYAWEKRCQRLGLPLGIRRVISYLYDKSSEYGYSYERAITWFFALQLGFCLTYAAISDRLSLGGDYDSRVVTFTFAQVVKPFELLSAKVPTEGAYGILQGNHGWWLLLTSLQSIASIALIALFLLALRWRFKRE
jgi:hypothetical protein